MLAKVSRQGVILSSVDLKTYHLNNSMMGAIIAAEIAVLVMSVN